MKLLQITMCTVVHILSVYIRFVQSSGCPCRATVSLDDVIANHVLRGHVVSTTAVADVGQCFHICVYGNVACKSFNIWKREDNGFWCELNKQNKDVDRSALERIAGRDYYEVNTRMLAKPYYFKNCNCKLYIKVTCECQDGYLGNQCDQKARSCQDHLRFKRSSSSGIYVVFDGNNTMFSVYCDMDVVNLAAWTLVLSYALQYNTDFNSTPFFVDNPLDEDNPNWSFYRLSLSRMYSIRSTSDFWRVSCNYTTYGIDKRDYAIARWSDIDLLAFEGSGCHRFTYINIRGSHCSSCTAWIHQGLRRSRMFLVAGRYGQREGCDLVAAPHSTLYEESFGYYTCISRQFRCTADDNSTTEFWFGGKI